MIRGFPFDWYYYLTTPRTRGDDPLGILPVASSMGYSPHTRG